LVGQEWPMYRRLAARKAGLTHRNPVRGDHRNTARPCASTAAHTGSCLLPLLLLLLVVFSRQMASVARM